MPKLINAVAATAFLAGAVFTFMVHGSPWTIGLLFAASVYLYVLAFTGLSSGLSDVHDAVGFIQDPAEAIVDRAADLLPEPDRGTDRPSPFEKLRAVVDGDEQNKEFDPDAVIARYLAERPPGGASPMAAAGHGAAPRTFGRRKA